MSNNTELIDKESLDKIVADIKAIMKRTSLDALNSVQWEFNQRYLFGNEVDKPLIKAGKLFTKEGPVAKGAIWTSLDTGKLWMNTGSGWKNIGGLNNVNKPDLIEIFHPRTDYPVEEVVSVTGMSGEQWISYPFKKYERYSVTKSQSPFTCFLSRTATRGDLAQDNIRTLFGSAASTNQFTCMVDDAKYFGFTTGSDSNLVDITITDLGSALEPVKVTNMTDQYMYITFPIEKGKRYYYTKTARSFYIGYGKGAKSIQNPDNRLKQVNNPGDSGAGSFSFVAEHDADWIFIFIGQDATLESFEFKGEDLPDYELTYPYVTRSANDKPENPKVGDMIFDAYQAGTSGSPLWWNGTNWVDAKASVSTLATTDAPVTANDGAIYYDTTDGNLKIWQNSGWLDIVKIVQSAKQVLYNNSKLPQPEEGMLRVNTATGYYAGVQVYNGNSWQYIQSTADRIFQRTVWNAPQDSTVGVENDGRFKFAYGGVKHTLAYLDEINIAQVVTFTDNSADETITANDTAKIIVTAAFGANSILDFSNITKVEGKTIEITNTANAIFSIKDGATTTALTDCNESIVRAICLSNVWHFYKVSGITEIVNQS